MGMDFSAIIGHKLTSLKALEVPRLIDESKEIFNIVSRDKEGINKRKSKWQGPFQMTEKNIYLIWEKLRNFEGTPIEGYNYYSDLNTYFADIAIYENTITVSPNPEHKYGNLIIPDACEYIIKLNREIARLFNSSHIVYCAVGYLSTGILDEKAREGWSIENIIKFGIDKFGNPPKEFNEAVHNYFFIDSFDLAPELLDPDKKVWSRYDDEYEKGVKSE